MEKAQLNPVWKRLRSIRILDRLWGSLLFLLGSALTYWLIRIGATRAWTGWEGKTLWDWMDLLIVPLSLALIAYLFSRQERKIDREIAAEQYQQRLLQDYLDRISKLLLDEELNESQSEGRLTAVARVLTLAVDCTP